ncbi:sensor histidine kinase [Luteipulveratus halotolerans]|uniref:histidine kinase n=1 Tax=Luteipulveratus halotolerans TaxID=1631356 RepID=A0A0L6CJB8_9MICO|nr:sensor histidine kinase [Luteipulveratus halotolerans]KNX37705.1 ATPase [Luteipulveratus halotolerans]
MPTLNDVLAEHPWLDPAASDWLHLLVGDWQLLSDLSFADLVLWVPRDDGGWTAAAHVRPTTGVGVFLDDLVGGSIDRTRVGPVDQAFRENRLVRAPQTMWRDDTPVREESIPVVVRGGTAPVAVVTRHTNLASMRTPSRLEVTYLATADALARMIATGEFPTKGGHTGRRRGAPRVGDGVLRLDREGKVTYASPNAVSAIHRLGYGGELVGVRLGHALSGLLPRTGPMDEELMPVLTGALPWSTELPSRSASVTVRSIPLSEAGSRVGAVLLVRDVSELRRRERELLTKDATIREIHHRVKNNLQTVAAVLRLQSRRLDDPGAKAALDDAVRRVATIALVHETLSAHLDDSVDFDVIAARGLQAAIEVANRTAVRVRGVTEGSFGVLASEDATVLAMVLAELVQNAVEHGLADRDGTVTVAARRFTDEGGDRLAVTVSDDGRGLPEGFEPGRRGLGTQIVLSLVQDLRGTIRWEPRPEGGSRVTFDAVLRPPADRDDPGMKEPPAEGQGSGVGT